MSEKNTEPRLTHRERQLQQELESLRAQLHDARETLEAIRGGAVDALIIDTPGDGQQVFTREGAERSYRAIIEQMQEGAATLTLDGTIHYCNLALATILDCPIGTVNGSHIEQYITPADMDVFHGLMEQAREGSARGEVGLVSQVGRVVPVHLGVTLVVEGAVESLCLVATNLTERKRHEARLRALNAELEERVVRRTAELHAVLNSSPVPIWIAHDRDCHSITGNAYADEIIFDVRRGANVSASVPANLCCVQYKLFQNGVELAAAQHPAQTAARTGQPVKDQEYEVRFPNGRRVHLQMGAVPLIGPDGQIRGAVVAGADITERKRVEEELAAARCSAEQAKASAEAASKAKDHFLAVLSHELRTPLAPVVATLSVLHGDARFDADTRENLEMIRRNVELEVLLIDDLLDVTRIERGKVELDKHPADLRDILRCASEVCMPDIQARDLEFGIDAPLTPCIVHADAARLQQVVWNLLKNAIKFTPKRGYVGIYCRRFDDHVIAEVNDSGMGIEPDVLPRIFNAFEQGDHGITRQFGGLGLGLAISKAIVDLHGGTLTAHSEGPGKGASFAIRLPLAAKGAASSTPNDSSSFSATAIRPLRILLVEDHGDTARVMRRLLVADGHTVHLAADLATALKLVAEQSLDLILSDLGLPDGSGLDLLKSIRAQGNSLPAIALSGYGQEHDMHLTREAGFTAHLVKPVSLPKLAEAIAKATLGLH